MGGAAGSMLRFLVQRLMNDRFPAGTLVVNLFGCFLIGIIWALASKNLDESRRLLLATGFCGGFTTFSAFSHEAVQMLVEDRWFTFAIYAGLSFAGGLLATYFGFKLFS